MWCSVLVVASAVAAGVVGVWAAVTFAVFSGDVAVVVAQGQGCGDGDDDGDECFLHGCFRDGFGVCRGGCRYVSCVCGYGERVGDLYQRSRLPIWKVRAEVAQASRVV